MQVKVAAIQMRSIMGDAVGNAQKLEQTVIRAAEQGARLIATPECSISGYGADDLLTTWCVPERHTPKPQKGVDVRSIAEPIPGPITERFGQLSKRLGIFLNIGLIEDGGDGKFYNTSLLLDPHGQIALHYRKIHPWPLCEAPWATRGNFGVPVAQTVIGAIAAAICYDIRFDVPALAAKNGANILLYSAAWTDDCDEDAQRFVDQELPEAARDHRLALIYANRNTLEKQWWSGSGKSAIYAADGSILSQSMKEFEEEIVFATLRI